MRWKKKQTKNLDLKTLILDETRNYFVEEIEQNKLMRNSIFAFAFLLGI